ncbi:aspartate kinase [Aliikangiella marina]|uniref:Aspartokinase n=1 Tax=Aliikangiella marina TaxID=1712262 RepID=A0A545T714_9GAMM|nr:aspartate kinase [Aliikangiella marina]TQV72978.1 aspartate kinase [Aliikangiella marina]
MKKQWVILKFGGSSVAKPSHWETIANAVQQVLDDGDRPLIVLSALKNVSNELERLLHEALESKFERSLNALKIRHLDFCKQLGIQLDALLDDYFNQLSLECQHIATKQKITPAAHARVLSYGELLSTQIGANYLNAKPIRCHWQDVRELLVSEDSSDEWHHFTSAICQFGRSLELVDKLPQSESVIVTQGFIASDKNQNTVLLGREGSDTSASYLAAKLGAKRIEIWTDVAGIFSANPREITNAQPIDRIDFEQANDLARLGAKVLHPRAIEPAASQQIPIKVKSTIDPKQPGTLITATEGNTGAGIIGIASEPKVSLLSVPEHFDSEITRNILAMGFDLLVTLQQENQHHLVFVYANSDSTQPADLEVAQVLPKGLSFQSGFGLVSLVGNFSLNMLGELKRKISSEVSKINSSYQLNDNAICFLTNSQDALDLSQQLHKLLIEK